MIPIIKKRFLTSFGMTNSWGESKGKSGDSLLTCEKMKRTLANRRFFPFTLINDMSFRSRLSGRGISALLLIIPDTHKK